MNPERIHYLFEQGTKDKQEDYLWPMAGKATVNDKVFIICDGAGSFYNGGIASKLICQYMAASVLRVGEQRMSGDLIDNLLGEAKERLVTYARENRLDSDLGTSFSMLIIYDQRVFLSWYGDSPIYHLRNGEILFKSQDNSFSDPTQITRAVAKGITADDLPIHAESRWIEDLQEGDCFLVCSKGLVENISDEDITLLVSENEKSDTDLAGSFRKRAVEKTPDNYSMYLIKLTEGVQKRVAHTRMPEIRSQSGSSRTPLLILAGTIAALFIMILLFRMGKSSAPPVVVTTTPPARPADRLRDDVVPSAIVMTAPRKPAADSIETRTEDIQTKPAADYTPAVQPEENPAPVNTTVTAEKNQGAQLLLKFSTDDACKLKITNMDLEEVINWDLAEHDNGIIYLKPGKYSILATSEADGSKTKTYYFEVKPGDGLTRQNLPIKF